ncbi:helix-turn-helix domain-containing protein [Fluviicola sp.]|uniref:AraC family transcriptional regulator n=1 Tax=Fluviicola sp. TaxID=1917219 RepID=UPI0026230DAD|nr:helix-turn-helix domain-containing protein [Fluviicola sp.]
MDIRKFYTPIQPTVRRSSEQVLYTEFLPHFQLQDSIYCYWELKTSHTLSEPFNYRVVADGCIDIFFELNNPEDSYVMGFCKKFTEFPLENTFHYIGIRFLPTMFPQLFRVNASELSNRFEKLDLVVPLVADYIRNRLNKEQTTEEIRHMLDHCFLKIHTTGNLDHDKRLYDALYLILKKNGVVDIQSDLQTGISSRQLRRLFEFYVGDTAKTFSQVVRFQNILKAKPSSESLKQNKLFFDSGYYDQSHFIKEFRNFYGVTPGKAFGR